MSEPDLLIWAKALLIKINVATGWELPQNEAFEIIADQFSKKMIESYPTVNPDEVEFAFLTLKIENWGKPISIYLIDDVMQRYLDERREVSNIEEQKKIKELPMSAGKITDNEMTDWWEQTALLVKKGNYSVDLIPPGLYEWMDEAGGINIDRNKKHEYIERATLYRNSMLASSYEKNPHNNEVKKELNNFNQMRESKKYSTEEHDRIKLLAKKMVVFDLMKNS